jgi:hypothetical protein
MSTHEVFFLHRCIVTFSQLTTQVVHYLSKTLHLISRHEVVLILFPKYTLDAHKTQASNTIRYLLLVGLTIFVCASHKIQFLGAGLVILKRHLQIRFLREILVMLH